MDRKEFLAWLLLRGFKQFTLGGYVRHYGPYVITADISSACHILIKIQDRRPPPVRMAPKRMRWAIVFSKRYRTASGAMRRILHYAAKAQQ